MEKLESVVKKIAEKIKKYNDEKIGRENTKVTLIEPIIEALGWDIQEPNEVYRGYNMGSYDDLIDYVLFINNSPKLLIEVRDLSTNLSDEKLTAQMIECADIVGVKWCILTNGKEYVIYNSSTKGSVGEEFGRIKIIADINQNKIELLKLFSKKELEEETANKLVKENENNYQVKKILDELLLGDKDNFIELIKEESRYKTLTKHEIKDALHRLDVDIKLPINILSGKTKKQINSNITKTKEKQEKNIVNITIEGKTYSCEYYRNIIKHVADWLIDQGVIRKEDCPITIGEAQSPNINTDKTKFKNYEVPKKLKNGVYIRANYSAENCKKFAKSLLKHFGYDEDILIIKEEVTTDKNITKTQLIHPRINKIKCWEELLDGCETLSCFINRIEKYSKIIGKAKSVKEVEYLFDKFGTKKDEKDPNGNGANIFKGDVTEIFAEYVIKEYARVWGILNYKPLPKEEQDVGVDGLGETEHGECITVQVKYGTWETEIDYNRLDTFHLTSQYKYDDANMVVFTLAKTINWKSLEYFDGDLSFISQCESNGLYLPQMSNPNSLFTLKTACDDKPDFWSKFLEEVKNAQI